MQTASLESLAALSGHCERFARQMLAKSGGFLPFGAFVDADDRLEAIAAQGAGPGGDARELYALLHGAIAQLAAQGRVKAYAIATDVTVPPAYEPPFPDGIRVQIEAPGYARHLYTPYRRLPWRALRVFLMMPTVRYAEPIPVDVAPDVFEARP